MAIKLSLKTFAAEASQKKSRPDTVGAAQPPRTGGYYNNHVLINSERHFRGGLKPLRRSRDLDLLAKRHAISMAQAGRVFNSCKSTASLAALLQSDRVGENVQRGETVVSMHLEAILDEANLLRNVLCDDYTEVGMATAKGRDGKLYCCQYYRR